MLGIGLAMLFAAITLLAAGIGMTLTSHKDNLLRRLELFADKAGSAEQGSGLLPVSDKKNIDIKRKDKNNTFISRNLAWIESELAKTDLLLRPNEYVGIVAVLAVCMGGAFYIIFRSILAVLASLAVSYVLSRIFIDINKKKRITKLGDQLVDTITLVSNCLKAGYSFFQAADMVSRDMRPPVSTEFGKMINQINMGMTVDEALRRLGERMESQDMDLVITAILIQRQIGGNLSEILDNISETIQGRIRLNRDIKAKTSQGRLSAIVLVLLTPVLAAVIFMMSPGFVSVIFSTMAGWIIIAVCLILQVIGITALVKIVNIEV